MARVWLGLKQLGHPGVHEARHRHSDRDQRPRLRRRNQRPDADGGPRCADALSQAQAEATKEAQRAGIEHAKARDDAYRGRKPSFTREQLGQVRDMLTTGTSISTIAKTTGLSRQAIYRLKDNPAWAEGVLATWAA